MGIKRRDFISGFAVAASGLSLRPAQAIAAGFLDPGAGDSYPPARTGMRGSHPGSFEVAHALAMEGKRWSRPTGSEPECFDLVVVGAGISGLAAAWYYRQQHGADARILIIDNHDDFGGHAKRNEFTVSGKQLIGYGGSQSIDGPATFSAEARGMLKALGIETKRFYGYFDRDFVSHHGLGSYWYFDQTHYGKDQLVENPLGQSWVGIEAPDDLDSVIGDMPISPKARTAFLRLLTSKRDWLSELSDDQQARVLRSTSYNDYLRRYAHMPEEVVELLTRLPTGWWGLEYDALSAMDAAEFGRPGTAHLAWMEEDEDEEVEVEEPYIFHFPDGNAGIARLLVRSLIPGAADGVSMEDMQLARVRYEALDRPGPTRLRLNATAIDVRHVDAGNVVEVTYVRNDRVETARARNTILACYNHVIPHICPELPAEQAEALNWPEKVPLVYISVALTNWRAFKRAGLYHVRMIKDFFCYGTLDFPVSMPGYSFSASPDEPIIFHLVHIPTAPGLPPKDQFRAGRAVLMGLSFSDYEREIRRLMSGMLGNHGFDFDADVSEVTVNRWPHGYTYEYIDLHDPADWGSDKGPHVTGRRPFGRVAIANSDSQALAFLQGAIDAAWRAVSELQSGQS